MGDARSVGILTASLGLLLPGESPWLTSWVVIAAVANWCDGLESHEMGDVGRRRKEDGRQVSQPRAGLG